jgi:DNA-directed RNA polymerase specialized sigma24 family protein
MDAPAATSEVVTAQAARLVLVGALIWAADSGMAATGWSQRDWDRLADALDPRELCVVALHGIRGLTHAETGDWLGISRGRSDQLWRRALAKLRKTELAAA